MRFLSTRRRHPAAKPLALVLALFVMGGLYAALAPATQSNADTTGQAQIAQGKDLFELNCSSCHGLNGEGTPEAPSLIGVGAASVDFQMETGRMPMARPGAQAPAKKTLYSAEEISAIAAYVASLGTGPAIPSEDQYSGTGLDAKAIARGGELFRANCSACHNFEGGGGALPNGKYAPPLTQTSDKHIYEAIRTGPQQMPVFSKGVLTDQDVKEIVGYLNTLHDSPNGGFDLGGLGPVGEGLWGWVIGLGGVLLIITWIASRGARAR
ncbi:c-type cytochrome [Propionibacteriaceae bacterium G1746]|uniref:cytochrome bc1 complex diheme cytochrome c subunit n=1 Tax=Aestuariimicrobium sp. G57 TaxID=3418485 RepID=UPI003C23BA86